MTPSLANIDISAECSPSIAAISEMMTICGKYAWWRGSPASHRDLQVLQELLGLAGTETIQIYTHLDTFLLRQMMPELHTLNE